MAGSFFEIEGRENVKKKKNTCLFTMVSYKLEVHHKELFPIANLHNV